MVSAGTRIVGNLEHTMTAFIIIPLPISFTELLVIALVVLVINIIWKLNRKR